MKKSCEIEAICLTTFSMVSASVSHEIKNCLAIINESAGLLDDLAVMAGEEGELPAGRVKNSAQAVMNQVKRANTIMKQLNRFAHSGDSPRGSGELTDLLELVAGLVNRQAAMNSVELQVNCPAPISLDTYLLPLESLIYHSLRNCCQAVSSGSSITLEGNENNGTIRVWLTSGKSMPDVPFTHQQEILADHLGGRLEHDNRGLCISFPAVHGEG